jgi:prepilin peptidase CpaA
MEELKSFLILAGMLVTDPRTVVLFVLLVVAAVIDVRSYRIPNWLTCSGAAFGLVYSTFVPFWPHHAFLWSLEGYGLGLGLLFPMWMLRILGAGDVKLMAMCGALLGVDALLVALAGSLIAGGLFAVAFSLRRGQLRRMLGNVLHVVQVTGAAGMAGVPGAAALSGFESVGKLPYSVAIAAGTIVTVVARHFGYL